MRLYDLVLVFKSALSEEKCKKLGDTVVSFAKGTKVVKMEDWGSKPLSYPIKKEVSGHYVYFALENETGVSTDFEKKILAQDDILRHLLVRTK